MWWIVEGIFQLLLKVDLCECCHCCAVLRWYKCICRGWTLLFQFHGGLSLVSSEWLCHLTLRGSWVSLSLHDRWPSGMTNTLHLLFRQVTNSLSLCLHLSVFQWMKLLWIIYRHRERCLANHWLHSVAKFLSLVVYVVTWCLWKVFAFPPVCIWGAVYWMTFTHCHWRKRNRSAICSDDVKENDKDDCVVFVSRSFCIRCFVF